MSKHPDAGSKPTIKEVARLAGVSFKTVSRVINNEPGVKDAKRSLVLNAIDRLRYSPNVSARRLAGKRSFLLALLYDYPTQVTMGMQAGAIERCRELGYHLVVEEAPEGAADETIRRLRDLRVDGVMIAPPLELRPGLLTALRKTDLRYVLLAPDKLDPLGACVRSDDERAAYDLVTRLIEQGHRTVAFIGARDAVHSSRGREGWRSALSGAGLPHGAELEAVGNWRAESGEAAAHQLLQTSPRPTAIFAANDFMAMGVLLAAARQGLSVPRDLSVAGFDDAFFAAAVSPRLTTVRLQVVAMGRAAVSLLTDREPPPAPTLATVGYEVIERESTGPARSAGGALQLDGVA